MRRFILIFAALLVFAASPAATSAVSIAGDGRSSTSGATDRCDISVEPRVGGPYDTFRVSGSGWPAGTDENPVHVLVTIRRAGDGRNGSAYPVHLVAGGTSFYFDYHADEGEGIEPLEPGRYLVAAETQDHGCTARTSFTVEV